MLRRSGVGISYDDVITQIKSFSAEVQNNVNLAQKNQSASSYHYRYFCWEPANTDWFKYNTSHKCNGL